MEQIISNHSGSRYEGVFDILNSRNYEEILFIKDVIETNKDLQKYISINQVKLAKRWYLYESSITLYTQKYIINIVNGRPITSSTKIDINLK